jgi:hypothetical protein
LVPRSDFLIYFLGLIEFISVGSWQFWLMHWPLLTSLKHLFRWGKKPKNLLCAIKTSCMHTELLTVSRAWSLKKCPRWPTLQQHQPTFVISLREGLHFIKILLPIYDSDSFVYSSAPKSEFMCSMILATCITLGLNVSEKKFFCKNIQGRYDLTALVCSLLFPATPLASP